jgi:predicted ribosome quality control (RQC) complex YloA/Tae2 family protein
MKTLTVLELAKVVKELQELIGARINKIYQIEDEFVFQLHKQQKFLLRFYPGMIYLSTTKRKMPLHQTGFCGWMRKYLRNAKITKITQVDGRKIVKITCETKDKTYTLYFDLFMKGNLIVTEKDKVVAARTFVKAKYRVVTLGEPLWLIDYTNIFILTQEEFVKKVMETTKKNISTTLATELSLSGLYAKEVCAKAEIDPLTNNISTREAVHAYNALQELLHATIDARVINNIAVPFALEIYADKKQQKFPTFNEALDKVLTEKKPEKKEKTKTEKILEKQEQHSIDLDKKSKENQRKGELLYEHYQELKELFVLLKDRKNWVNVKRKALEKEFVKEITDTGEIVVEFS